MHKKFITAIIWFAIVLAIGISLLTGQKNTFAWSSNNDYIDDDFWINDRGGNDNLVKSALFGDGNIWLDSSYYTQYRTNNTCDISAMSVQYIVPWTNILPNVLTGNTIYVLDVWAHYVSTWIVFSWDCIGLTAKNSWYTTNDVAYLYSSWSTVLSMSWNKNIVINNFYIDSLATTTIKADYINNSSILPMNIRYSTNAMVFNNISNIFLGGSISDVWTWLYINGWQNIKYGTTRPVALSRFSGTGLYITNTSGMVIDADIAHNTNVGWYFENVSNITINSRYWTQNGWPWLYLSGWTNINILGWFFGANNWVWLLLQNTTGLLLNNVEANQNIWHGIQVINATGVMATNITTNLAAWSNYGFLVSNVQNISITNHTATQNGWYWIELNQVNNFNLQNINESGNNVIWWNIYGSTSWIINNMTGSFNTYGNGLNIVWSNNIIINNSYFTRNGVDGIYIDNTSSNITMNTIRSQSNDDDGLDIAGVQNFTLTNYTVWENVGHGIDISENAYSGYLYSWYMYSNVTGGLFINDGANNILVDKLQSRANHTFWLSLDLATANIIKNIYSRDNWNDGVFINDADLNTLTNIHTYGNLWNWLSFNGSDQNRWVNIISFNNAAVWVILDRKSNQNKLNYLQTYNNNMWIHVVDDLSERNVLSNIITYNNYTNASVFNYTTLNNIASFNGWKWILFDWSNNTLNNANVFNNQNGITVYDLSNNNNIHATKSYNNTIGVQIDAWSVGNTYNGLNLFANTTHLWGTNGSDAALSQAPWWYPWAISASSNLSGSDIMTCDRAIQATNISWTNLLQYPYCNTRSIIAWWTWSLWVKYTFFPNIQKQIFPVEYVLPLPTLATTTPDPQPMFIGDYTYTWYTNFGGYIILANEGTTFTSGGFTYRYDTGSFDIIMDSNSGTNKSFVVTWVNDVMWNGLLWSTWSFSTTQYTLSSQYLLPWNGLKIFRVGYDIAGQWLISNYYGQIRWIAAPVCGNTIPESGEECDDGNLNNLDGCSDSCILDTWLCTIQAVTSTWYTPFNVTFNGTWSSGFLFDYIDYGDGTTWLAFNHIYTNAGVYNVVWYEHNTLSWAVINTCVTQVQVYNIPALCELPLQPNFVISNYLTGLYVGTWGWAILNTITFTSTTIASNTIDTYQWNVYSSWDFFWWMISSPYVFDNALISSWQWTPSVELDFSQYVNDGNRPFIWIELIVTDVLWYQAEYLTPLFRDHDQWGLYWIAGNTITNSIINGFTVNMTGEMLASSTDANIIPSNQLYFPDVGPIPNVVGIDRENIGINDEFFPYPWAYSYSHTYNTWVYILNLNTSIWDLQDNFEIGQRTYPIACAVSCGNGEPEWIEECDEGVNNGLVCDPNGQSCSYCSNNCRLTTVVAPYCWDWIPQNIPASTTSGTIDYVIYGDMYALTGNAIYNYSWYQSGMLFEFNWGINTWTIVSYQWELSWSDVLNPGITTFIVWSTTWSTIQVFSNALGQLWSDRNGNITLTMTDADGNVIQIQWYITAYIDGMSVIYTSLGSINISWSSVVYSDYQISILGSTALFPPSQFVNNVTTWWTQLFSNGWWAGYDRYNDGLYDYTQQGTWQTVQYIYDATWEYITTNVSFFFSWFGMNLPANIGDLYTTYTFHTTEGVATSWYQEDCDDGNLDDFDGCTSQCQVNQCTTTYEALIDPKFSFSSWVWSGDQIFDLYFESTTLWSWLMYNWSLGELYWNNGFSWSNFSGQTIVWSTWSSIFHVQIETLGTVYETLWLIHLEVWDGINTWNVQWYLVCKSDMINNNTAWCGLYFAYQWIQSFNWLTPVFEDQSVAEILSNTGAMATYTLYDQQPWNDFIPKFWYRDYPNIVPMTTLTGWSVTGSYSYASGFDIISPYFTRWLDYIAEPDLSKDYAYQQSVFWYQNTCFSDCGNSIEEIGEDCDRGGDNSDVACIPGYNQSCNYCTMSCDLVNVGGWYCWDGTVDTGYIETASWFIQDISSIDIYAVTWYVETLTWIKQWEEFEYSGYVYTFTADLTWGQIPASYSWTLLTGDDSQFSNLHWYISWSSTWQNIQIEYNTNDYDTGRSLLNITIVTTSWYILQTQASVYFHENGIEVSYHSSTPTIVWNNSIYYSSSILNIAGMSDPENGPSTFYTHNEQSWSWGLGYDRYNTWTVQDSTGWITYIYNMNTWMIITNIMTKPPFYQNQMITIIQWWVTYVPAEECDLWPLNENPVNGCSSTCQIILQESGYCGDGSIGLSEQCDDGNNIDGDWCSSQCTSEQRNCSWFTGMNNSWYAPHTVSLNIVPGIYTWYIFNPINRWDNSYGNIFTSNTHIYNNIWSYNASIRVRPAAGWLNAVPSTVQIQCSFPITVANRCGNGVIDTWEQCDIWQLNGQYNSWCSSSCTVSPLVCTLPFVYTYTWGGMIYSWSSSTFGITLWYTGNTFTGNYTIISYISTGWNYLQLTWNSRNQRLWTYGSGQYTGLMVTNTGVITSWSLVYQFTGAGKNTGNYTIVTQLRQNQWNTALLCNDHIFTGAIVVPYCGNSIVEAGEQCDGGSACTSQCKIKSSWWGGGAVMDYCPAWDFSPSYYDRQCGSAPMHGSAPIGKFCIYEDEKYLTRWSFDDVVGHWWELPIEVMRLSCLHRGRHTKSGLRRYEPNANIQRDEVLKTLVKIVGIKKEDFIINSEELLYTGVIPFADVMYSNWFSHYARYAFTNWLTEWLYITQQGNKLLDPTKNITRYEATKAIVIAYEKIQWTINIQWVSGSKITDVAVSNPYYTYVRKAEVAKLVEWYPQKNKTFVFRGDALITRAEFAKIIASAFNERLIDAPQVVLTSSTYSVFAKAIQETKMDKLTFIRIVFEKMRKIDDTVFLQKFKVSKDVFIKTLSAKLLLPMIQK